MMKIKEHTRRTQSGRTRVKQHTRKSKTPSIQRLKSLYGKLQPHQEIYLETNSKIIYIPFDEMTNHEKSLAEKHLLKALSIDLSELALSLNQPLTKWEKVKCSITSEDAQRYLNSMYGPNWFNASDRLEHGVILFGYVKNKTLYIKEFEPVSNDMLQSLNWNTNRNRGSLEFDTEDIDNLLIQKSLKGLKYVGTSHVHPSHVGQRGGINPGSTPQDTVSPEDLQAWKSENFQLNRVGGIINLHQPSRTAFWAFYFKPEKQKKKFSIVHVIKINLPRNYR